MLPKTQLRKYDHNEKEALRKQDMNCMEKLIKDWPAFWHTFSNQLHKLCANSLPLDGSTLSPGSESRQARWQAGSVAKEETQRLFLLWSES